VLKDIGRAPKLFQPFLKRVILDPTGFRRSLLEAMPRMLFALLPVFALIVGLFYRHRKYPEHLYFAIHLHAFVFLALAIFELAKFSRVNALVVIAGILTMIWVPSYAALAFRRAYGASWIGTLTRQVAIGAIYSTVTGVAFLVTIYVVAVYG
jgi:hypothetical protein